MALQTSGAISLADIQTEFGGSNPIGLNEYYGAASGIPASGAIDFADFYGATNNPYAQYTSGNFRRGIHNYTLPGATLPLRYDSTYIPSNSINTSNFMELPGMVNTTTLASWWFRAYTQPGTRGYDSSWAGSLNTALPEYNYGNYNGWDIGFYSAFTDSTSPSQDNFLLWFYDKPLFLTSTYNVNSGQGLYVDSIPPTYSTDQAAWNNVKITVRGETSGAVYTMESTRSASTEFLSVNGNTRRQILSNNGGNLYVPPAHRWDLPSTSSNRTGTFIPDEPTTAKIELGV